MPLTRLPADKVRAHRELTPVRDGGRVEVYTYPTSGTELDNVADILRRAHLEDGVPWGDMAVLVRAGSRTIPTVRRALTAAGVPLDIDGDDLPLRTSRRWPPADGPARGRGGGGGREERGGRRRGSRRTGGIRPAGRGRPGARA